MGKEKVLLYKWNPWTGCKRKSQGCQLCSSSAFSDEDFFNSIKINFYQLDLPIQTNANGEFIIPSNSIIAFQYNGDFFTQQMDQLRPLFWNIIRIRKDCIFHMSTKRPQNIKDRLPIDWGEGWQNVYINCTTQNQKRVDERLPIYLNIPLKHYIIAVQPILENVNIKKFLQNYKVDQVIVEGQYHLYPYTYQKVRPCNYNWIKNLYNQCYETNTNFYFFLTGTKWINQKQQEISVNPNGHDMENLAKKCNFNNLNKGFFGSMCNDKKDK